MTFDEVRVIHSGEPTPYREQALRSPAQKHTDAALQTAMEQLTEALEAAEGALAWLRSVGAIPPRRLQDIPIGMRQLITFVEDEQRRRG